MPYYIFTCIIIKRTTTYLPFMAFCLRTSIFRYTLISAAVSMRYLHICSPLVLLCITLYVGALLGIYYLDMYFPLFISLCHILIHLSFTKA